MRGQEVCQRYAESFCESTDGREANVGSTLLKTGQTRLGDIDELRQFRLGKAGRFPSLPEFHPKSYRVGVPEGRAAGLFCRRRFFRWQSRGSGRSRSAAGYGLLGRQAHVSGTSGRVVLKWYQERHDSTSERWLSGYDESPRFGQSGVAWFVKPAFLFVRRTLARDESPRSRQAASLVTVNHPFLSHWLAAYDESPMFWQAVSLVVVSRPSLSHRSMAYDESPRFCWPIGFLYQTLIRVYWRFIVDNPGCHWRFIAIRRFATLAIHRAVPIPLRGCSDSLTHWRFIVANRAIASRENI